LTLPMGLNTV